MYLSYPHTKYELFDRHYDVASDVKHRYVFFSQKREAALRCVKQE